MTKLDRNLTPHERNEFDRLTESLTCIKGLSFSKALNQVNLLGRTLAVLGKQWKPSSRNQQLRETLDDLAEKSISGRSTPEDEAKLQKWLDEADKEMPFVRPKEAWERGLMPAPGYKVYASGAPPNSVYKVDETGKILLGSWIEREQADNDVIWWQSKGFSNVRVEEE